MSVEMMMESDDDHDQGLRMKGGHDQGNKHSYFLRAKTPRFLGLPVGDDDDHEDGEIFKKPPSSISRVGMDKERAPPPFPLPPSRSKTDHLDEYYTSLSEEEDLANCLVMLSNKSHSICSDDNNNNNNNNKVKEVVEKGMFQCKACKKVFNSHQALGGHRASHKKVKGCFASKIDGLNDEENIDIIEDSNNQEDQEASQLPPPPEPDSGRPTAATRKRAKMHECSVCRRVFSSGQALGGHKRCHWLTTSTDNAFIPNFHDFQYDHRSQQLCKKPIFTKPHQQQHDHDLDLNLNLPPAPHHDHQKRDDHGGGGGDKEKEKEREKSSAHHEAASTRLCLQQWSEQNKAKVGKEVGMERNGEEGCGMKLRKLSDLRDVNLDGGWLQMGIPSTSEMR